MMQLFEINGGKKLSGEIEVNSSKNAAVALLAASTINSGKTTLRNVPQIEEVNRWIEILESVGAKIEKDGRNLEISYPNGIEIEKINQESAQKTRSVILLLGALSGKMEKYSIPQSGGCKLGSRTVRPHLFALENFGIKIACSEKSFDVEARDLKAVSKIVLYESGDTVTENALLAAAQIAGKTSIHLASANYMVQDLCFFLEKLGVKISGVGTSGLEIEGVGEINKDVEYEISEDPIEAMFFISLAVATKSEIIIKRAPIDFLELELLKLEKMGQKFEIEKEYFSRNERTKLVDIRMIPSELRALEDKIHSLPFPGINIDNLPFFVPIAMEAKGRTLIHDWVFENRAIYFTELNRLGARVTLLDPHRVYVEGPNQLKGAEMMCPPALRPSAIVLVAMLAAEGKSILRDVYNINRGYENLEERLRKLGAEIKLINVN
ncbi:MAG: UDP-N-acetylglucosamine 1-carboxyvinyltransferase [Candidatus Moranbacteria bacterium]|jgi:UDP-N-acetylglucosamine 1-carboxyvinyltransferase|nr:UDP-N-acetylglucosamine 1-carboxyvinyltransferase [Candidatus Moranbacteria bacterium]